MVNLTCLIPEIVAAILEDELPHDITLFELAVAPEPLWEQQLLTIGWHAISGSVAI